MRLRQLLYVVPVVALATLSSTAGCSSTSTQRATARNAGTATTGNTTSGSTTTAGGAVHLTDYTDNDGPTSTVVLSGAIGDFGKVQRVKIKHNSELNLMLTHGSFRLDIADLDKKFIGSTSGLVVNTSTCSATASVSGAVPIATGSGTGSYKGISGTFNLTITLDEVYQPNACSETSAYLAQSIITAGPGTVAFR